MNTTVTKTRTHIWETTRIVLTVVGIAAIVFLIFGLLPPREPMIGDSSIVLFAVAIDIVVFTLLIGGIVAWQRRRIQRTQRTLGALIEAIALVFLLFIGVTARLYHVISVWYPDSFNRSLDFMDAVYFSMTIFSTVGFGDIYPQSHLAQGIVIVQMVLNLILLGVVVRILVEAARTPSPQTPQQPSEQTGA